MTNSSPQLPQPPESAEPSPEEKRFRNAIRRNTRQQVTDEWIAIIVAFGTIGAILFWALGGKKNDFAPFSTNKLFSSSSQNTFIGTDLSNSINSQIVTTPKTSENLKIKKTLGGEKPETIASLNNNFITPRPQSSFGTVNKYVVPAPVTTPTTPVVPPPRVIPVPLPIPEPEAVKPEVTPEPEVVKPEPEAVKPEVTFPDVTQQYWAYPFVKQLGEKQLIPDTSNFQPDELITRAGMASLISQAFDLPVTQGTKNFSDIAADSDVAKDINEAVGIGFMKGYSDQEFNPTLNIPRYQVLVTLATGLGLEPDGDPAVILQNFGDSKELPDWALKQVAAAIQSGLVINRPEYDLNSLKPNDPATRAEVAAMIHQALVKSGKVDKIDSKYIVPSP